MSCATREGLAQLCVSALSKDPRSTCVKGLHDLSDPDSVYVTKQGHRRCRECKRLARKQRPRTARNGSYRRDVVYVDPSILLRYVNEVLPRYGSWDRIASECRVRKSVYSEAVAGKPMTLHILDTIVTRTGGITALEVPHLYE